MKSKKAQLTVQPLTKYKEPKYPRIGDIDIDDALSSNPYPFRAGFKSYVATAGLTVVFTHLSAADESVKSENPFRVADSGLPHQSSPYGTGAPSYLSEETARRVISQVFKEEGYQLKEDFLFKQGDEVSFVADGYDDGKKIGYVWGDWNSLDHKDAIESWSKPKLDEKSIDRILEGTKNDNRHYEHVLSRVAYYVERNKGFGSFKAQYEAALAVPQSREQLTQLAAVIEQLNAPEDPKRISLREAKELENQGEGKNEYIALISCFDRRFQYSHWGQPLDAEKQALIKKLQQGRRDAKSDGERQKLGRRIEEVVAKDALTNLETAVRSYIDWAERQGL